MGKWLPTVGGGKKGASHRQGSCSVLGRPLPGAVFYFCEEELLTTLYLTMGRKTFALPASLFAFQK